MSDLHLFKEQSYRLLSIPARLVLRELAEIAWETESCRVVMDTEVLAEKLGWEQFELQAGLDELLRDGHYAIEALSSDLDTIEVELPHLVLPAKEAIARNSQGLSAAAKERDRADRGSLGKRLMARKTGASAPLIYLDNERAPEDYEGWLPTKGFQNSGQAYVVRDSLVEELKKISGSISVDEELRKMYRFLMANPVKRPRIATANQWVRSWVSRAAESELGVKRPNKISRLGSSPVASVDEVFFNV